jgi:hypothetical protein
MRCCRGRRRSRNPAGGGRHLGRLPLCRRAEYARVYGHPHGAPARLAEFTCAVPEHLADVPTPHVAHPGCFSTATLLAVVPLLKLGLVEPELFVSAVTGSTGAGRSPTAGTHHPQRHSPTSIPMARSRTGTRRRSPPSPAPPRGRSPLRLRTPLGPVRARHPRDGAGAARAPDEQRGAARGARRVLRGPAVRARARRAAAHQGRGDQQLRPPLGGLRRPDASPSCRSWTTWSRAPPAARSSG